MGLQIPDELKPVAALVVAKWPETDETGLRGAADRWDEMGALLGQLNDLGDDVVQVVLAHTEGETHDAIEAFWKKAGGDGGALTELADFCEDLAFVLRVMATLVLAVKLYIIAMLVYLAVQLAIAAASSVATLGASVAEGAAVQMAVRTMISTALRELLQEVTVRTVVKGVAIGASIGLLKEVGFQSLEMKLGVRDGYSGLDIASATVTGGIVGGVAAPVSKVLNSHGPSLTGNHWGDLAANHVIGKHVGKAVTEVLWDEPESIPGRVVSDVGKYVRNEIVEELSKPTTSSNSSLDLPPQ